MKIVVIFGSPGSGKGTIASRLTKLNPQMIHVSSGDMLRKAVEDHTAVGLEAESYMRDGALVPDEIIGRMISEYIASVDSGTIVLLDGFPRTLTQADILDEAAQTCACSAEVSLAVLLDISDEVVFDRVAGRRGCPACGAGYHVTNIPPRVAGICDNCGTALVIRKDDTPETVAQRIAIYKQQTVPLIAFYAERGILRRVPATGSVDDIVALTQRAISENPA